ncbi:MAG: response regulator [Nitrospirae bacterium]|nr:response regulator [Nitrospirota bacterium]
MKKTVLVIDNDTASSSLISKTLEPEGYLVFSASSGDASITMAKKVTPLLIFLNLATPGTGLEICKSIRNIPALKDTPIVLLTIRESKFDPRYKSLYGIVDFLKKPFTSDDIASKVNSIIAPLAMPEEKEVPPFEPEEPVVSTTWDLPQVEEPQEEAFEDFRVKEPIIKKDMFEETEKEPSAMPEEEKLIIEKPTPPQKPKTEPVKPIKEPDEFFPSETEETAEVFTPISEPVLGKKESTKKKKRLKVSSKSRNIRVPAIAVLVVAVLGFAVYWYLQRKPQVDIGRRPAEVLSTADTASKPLKKPHITIEPEVILADIEAPQIELKGQVPKKPAYYVQFGAFSSEKNANALVLDLKAKAEETFPCLGPKGKG